MARGVVVAALVLGALLGLGALVVGVLEILRVSPNKCEMSYMWPGYVEVPLTGTSSRYRLHLYREGGLGRGGSGLPLLEGVPVLFLPGNAGSYQQARSLGSHLDKLLQGERRKGAQASPPQLVGMDLFTIDFNEEHSAFYGGILHAQAQFTQRCVAEILQLYASQRAQAGRELPSSVVLVGHSMGGVVARALFSLPSFDSRTVRLIVTLASPNLAPPAATDPGLVAFFHETNRVWRANGSQAVNHVTLVSIAGGRRDLLVASELSLLPHTPAAYELFLEATALKGVWVQADHQCILWCRQLTAALAHALLRAIDPSSKQVCFMIFREPSKVVKPFRELVDFEDSVLPAVDTKASQIHLKHALPLIAEHHYVISKSTPPQFVIQLHQDALSVVGDYDFSDDLSLFPCEIGGCGELSHETEVRGEISLRPRIVSGVTTKGKVFWAADVLADSLLGSTRVLIQVKASATKGRRIELHTTCAACQLSSPSTSSLHSSTRRSSLVRHVHTLQGTQDPWLCHQVRVSQTGCCEGASCSAAVLSTPAVFASGGPPGFGEFAEEDLASGASTAEATIVVCPSLEASKENPVFVSAWIHPECSARIDTSLSLRGTLARLVRLFAGRLPSMSAGIALAALGFLLFLLVSQRNVVRRGLGSTLEALGYATLCAFVALPVSAWFLGSPLEASSPALAIHLSPSLVLQGVLVLTATGVLLLLLLLLHGLCGLLCVCVPRSAAALVPSEPLWTWQRVFVILFTAGVGLAVASYTCSALVFCAHLVLSLADLCVARKQLGLHAGCPEHFVYHVRLLLLCVSVLCLPALAGSLVVWVKSLPFSMHLEKDPFVWVVQGLLVAHVTLRYTLQARDPSASAGTEGLSRAQMSGMTFLVAALPLVSPVLYSAVVCLAVQMVLLSLGRSSVPAFCIGESEKNGGGQAAAAPEAKEHTE